MYCYFSNSKSAFLIFLFSVSVANAGDFECPAPSVQASADLKGEISGKAQAFLKIGDADIQGTIQKTVVDLYSKYPNADRVAIINTLISTTCNFIKSSSQLSDAQKLDRWMAVYPSILSLMPKS
jgi:hypothetical protein